LVFICGCKLQDPAVYSTKASLLIIILIFLLPCMHADLNVPPLSTAIINTQRLNVILDTVVVGAPELQ